MFALGWVVHDQIADVRGNAGIFARQIRADDLPAVAGVGRLEQNVRAEIERVRRGGRKNQRGGAIEAVFSAAQNYGRDVLRLAGNHVEARGFAAVDQIGMQRIGRHVSIFFGADRMPIAKSDFSPVAAAGDSGRATFLLSAVYPVGKWIVGNDVIELRGGLVVPGAPGFAAVDGGGGALVCGEQNNSRIFGIDPDGVIVVAAGSAFDGGKIHAAIAGAIGGSVADINDVRIFGRDAHPGEIGAASPDALFMIDALPAFSGVVGAIEAAYFGRGVNQRIDAIWIAGRNAKSNPTQALRVCRQTFVERIPGFAAVGGLEQTPAVAFERAAGGPGRAAGRPHVRIENLRIFGIEGEVGGTGVIIFVENFLPGSPAVAGAEDAALGVWPVRMAEDGNENAIGILRVDDDVGDLLAVAQAQVLPGFSAVAGFVDAVAGGKIGTAETFAAAHINNVSIARRDGKRADGAGGLTVEDGEPGATGIGGFPDAAVVYADVKEIWIAGDAGGGYGAASTEGADAAPLKIRIEAGKDLLVVYMMGVGVRRVR